MKPIPEAPGARATTRTAGWLSLRKAAVAVAVVYAFLAAMHTILEFDMGWQLAMGRWILQHHRVPSTDVLSYAAVGHRWIYPPLSGIVLYLVHLIGGYAALTWLSVAACVAVTAFLARDGRLGTALLAALAVPMIAANVTPRANLFTTLLFAVLLRILWRYHRTGIAKLWVIPIITLAWVNLHWGFVAGLGLLAAYVGLELIAIPFPSTRPAAIARLGEAWPWIGAAFVVVLINPWGPRIFVEAAGWGRDFATPEAAVLRDFFPLRMNWATAQTAVDWRDPAVSAIWWMLVAAAICVLVAAWRRNIGAILFLIAASAAAIQRARFQGMFACVVVVVGGSMLAEAADALQRSDSRRRLLRGTAWALSATAGILVMVRGYDLVTNRTYLVQDLPTVFGAGLSTWFPERALAFMEKEHIPGNVFNAYVYGGVLSWERPDYPVFVDPRGRPFEPDVLPASRTLSTLPPDAPSWDDAVKKWGINTIVVPTGRVFGMTEFRALPAFCGSQAWRPVYLDEVSAVLVRRTAETESLVQRFPVDCATVQFAAPVASGSSARGRAELFDFWSNAGFIYDKFGRREQSLRALNQAAGIFDGSGALHFQRGTLLAEMGDSAGAERELRRAIALQPNSAPWYLLARLLFQENRDTEGLAALYQSADLARDPSDAANKYLEAGFAHLQLRQPDEALAAYERASEFQHSDDFRASVAEGRAAATMLQGNPQQAIEYQHEAVRLAPGDRRKVEALANLYRAAGMSGEADRILAGAQ